MKQENLKRIYVDSSLSGNHLSIDDPQIISRLINVLRLRIGDSFIAFNPTDRQRLSKILEISRKTITCELGPPLESLENNLKIALAFSPIKTDRMRFLIEKCTEIGIKSFIPIKFSRTIISDLNCDKLGHYIISACEQSGRISIPSLTPPTSLAEFLITYKDCAVLFCNEKENSFWLKDFAFTKNKTIVVLIGPEGGLTDQERETLADCDFVQSISLGRNILRSETAAIVATGYCSSLD